MFSKQFYLKHKYQAFLFFSVFFKNLKNSKFPSNFGLGNYFFPLEKNKPKGIYPLAFFSSLMIFSEMHDIYVLEIEFCAEHDSDTSIRAAPSRIESYTAGSCPGSRHCRSCKCLSAASANCHCCGFHFAVFSFQ